MVAVAGDEEGFAVFGGGGGGEAEAVVLVVEFGAAFVIEEGEVPLAFERVGRPWRSSCRREKEKRMLIIF